jgi:sortase (surface protein transpeptidase)
MCRIIVAAIIASLAVPAFAAEDPSKAEQYRYEEQKKKESEESEKAYQDTLKRMDRQQPAKKTDKWDPWGSMRR